MKRDELENKLKEKKILWSRYNLYGSNRDNALTIEKNNDGLWEVYYFEKGSKFDCETFQLEDDACQYLFDLLVEN